MGGKVRMPEEGKLTHAPYLDDIQYVISVLEMHKVVSLTVQLTSNSVIHSFEAFKFVHFSQTYPVRAAFRNSMVLRPSYSPMCTGLTLAFLSFLLQCTQCHLRP